jgi:hypothetical protein
MRPFSGGILVAHWKHGDVYYHVPTEAHLHAAALNLLNFHNENGYYAGLKHDEDEERQWGPKHPGMEAEEIEKLPEGPIRDAARKSWKEWSSYQDRLKLCNDEWKDIQHALKTKNGVLAWQILQERRDHEYERVSIESLESENLELLPRPKKPTHGQRWTDPEGQRWIFDGKKEGRGLGWIKGDHAQWRVLYAAHESGEMEPEITQYDLHWVASDAWSSIYRASKDGQTAGAVKPLLVSPKDFKELVEDLVEFAKHPDQRMLLVTDPDQALKSGEAVLKGTKVRQNFTCTVKADESVEPYVEYEGKKRRRRKKK